MTAESEMKFLYSEIRVVVEKVIDDLREEGETDLRQVKTNIMFQLDRRGRERHG